MSLAYYAQSGLCAELTNMSIWQGIKVQTITVPIIMRRGGVADYPDSTLQPFVHWERNTFPANMWMPCTSAITHDCVQILLQSLTWCWGPHTSFLSCTSVWCLCGKTSPAVWPEANENVWKLVFQKMQQLPSAFSISMATLQTIPKQRVKKCLHVINEVTSAVGAEAR